ncbi:hypothetical protein B0J15DRAFT_547197 [Fusarium solani]|uniref:Branchpoint-bridging protein n=1 Tax=Fusarium solani TaxID=169388 RepID=A0A9P9KPM2_FUSSL|nr:uncharacterized protein B0J15DRAFT_547197 [Fusarium solani]KAH7264434.1 hypothetical protein B0J15DRAFT_547197 [Fusarium solani]
MRTIPAYCPPYDYRRPMIKTSEKTYLLVTDFISINLIGEILGPRGRSLKATNAESGVNIAPCGVLSRKAEEGHAWRLLTMAGSLFIDVIETAISTPRHEDKRKAQQLRDLAIMNGNFRDDESQQHQGHANRLIEAPGTDQAATNLRQQPATDNQQNNK